jgi:hypothetical protein
MSALSATEEYRAYLYVARRRLVTKDVTDHLRGCASALSTGQIACACGDG